MADNTQIKWLYPPNFEGTYPSDQKNGHRRHIILCTNYSDGTGEDSAIKLKRIDMLTPSGNIPSKLVIEKISYQISGMTVYVGYDNDNDNEDITLYTGDGDLDFTSYGGHVPADETEGVPFESGNVVITTANETAADSYNIILTVRLKD